MMKEKEVMMNDSSTQADEHQSTNPISKKGDDDWSSNSKGMMVIVYKECLKNHAAAMGAHSTDGCGEFMPSSGEEDALLCSACGCHRNFHRKEVDVGGPGHTYYLPKCHYFCNNDTTKHLLEEGAGAPGDGPHTTGGENVGPVTIPSGIDGKNIKVDDEVTITMRNKKKRHRTRFTNEQKERMLEFAQKVGWRIQKANEGLLHQFCQEVGIKKKVLKVWMHNNKHIFVKKISNSLPSDHHANDSTNKQVSNNPS